MSEVNFAIPDFLRCLGNSNKTEKRWSTLGRNLLYYSGWTNTTSLFFYKNAHLFWNYIYKVNTLLLESILFILKIFWSVTCTGRGICSRMRWEGDKCETSGKVQHLTTRLIHNSAVTRSLLITRHCCVVYSEFVCWTRVLSVPRAHSCSRRGEIKVICSLLNLLIWFLLSLSCIVTSHRPTVRTLCVRCKTLKGVWMATKRFD